MDTPTATYNNVGLPFFSSFSVDKDLVWQMSRAEKYCLIETLQNLRPDVSVEIGTYKGGSLQVLSHFSKNVYSVDISTEPRELLKDKFDNVEFVISDSSNVITSLITDIESKGRKVEFILIDGDHSRKGVYRDLKAVLDIDWQHDVTIILHDSFNPECRRGMLMANFKEHPKVSYVEIDYIGGCFSHNGETGEMWGGFAMVKISKTPRTAPLVVEQSLRKLFNATYMHSKHLIKDRLLFLRPLKDMLLKK